MTPNNQYEQDMEICRAALGENDEDWFTLEFLIEKCGFWEKDAEHIAHFSPQRVIQILERQRDLESLVMELLDNTKDLIAANEWRRGLGKYNDKYLGALEDDARRAERLLSNE